MTGPIAFLRKEIVKDLTRLTDLPVFSALPETLEPPCILINEGSTLLTPAEETYGTYKGQFDLLVIAPAIADNAQALAKLDTQVDGVVMGLAPEYLLTVRGYQTFQFANAQPYLGAVISLQATVNIF